MKASLFRSGSFYLLLALLIASWAWCGWVGGPELEWARLIPNECGAPSLTAVGDAQSNVYVGSGPLTGLSKYDAAGNLLWTWGRPEHDGSGHVWVRAISVDREGSRYLSGGGVDDHHP